MINLWNSDRQATLALAVAALAVQLRLAAKLPRRDPSLVIYHGFTRKNAEFMLVNGTNNLV